MPKRMYATTVTERLTPQQKEVHPVWRGIGFLMLILIPIISISTSILLVNANLTHKWIAIPRDLLLKFADPYILVKAIVAFFIGFLLFIMMTLITFLANRFWGPPRYGPFDVPSEEFKRRKR